MQDASPLSGPAREDALAEIARIDFLLTELTRAVESGELHRASYDLMAPRHLDRRAELVADVTGVPREAPTPSPAAAPAVPSAVPPVAAQVAFDRFASGGEPAMPARRTRRPVRWTTVLTFLGAFLVVVAAAIFAVTVWESVETVPKLVFLGVLTVLFFAAGAWAHRSQLQSGAMALTAVASAMLLFEGWIAIDGFDLTGPLPWAVVLLVCSVVYWAAELLLAGRFFGVVGAAAQIGWWWLLGMGLGMTVPVRLAGIAAVAAVWQLAADRGRDDPRTGTLARVLEWAAPAVTVLIVPNLLSAGLLMLSADAKAVGAAAIASACAVVVVGRSRLIPKEAKRWLAAIGQLPLLVFAGIAAFEPGPSWWIVVVLAVMALVYDSVAMVSAGIPFAVIGLFAEAGCVLETCAVLDVESHVAVMAMAVLAAFWALAARLIEREVASAEPAAAMFGGLSEVGAVARFAAFALMVAASVAVLATGDGVALLGYSASGAEVTLAFGVLLAWYASSSVLKSGVFAFGGSVWSFYALMALLSWAWPGLESGAYAIPLVLLGGVWIASGTVLERRFGGVWGGLTRWAGRAAVLLVVLACPVERFETAVSTPAWWVAGLAVAAAAVYAADAVHSGCQASSVAAAVLGVQAGSVAAMSEWADVAGVADAWLAVGGAMTAALVAAALVALRKRVRDIAPPAVAGALFAALFRLAGAWDRPGYLAVACLAMAVAFALASAVTTSWLAAASGISLFAGALALLAHFDPGPALGAGAIVVTGLVLGLPALARGAWPEKRREHAVLALAGSGIAAQVSGVLIAWAGAVAWGDVWYDFGPHAPAFMLVALAAHVVAQSVRRGIEPGLYVAGFSLVLAAWSEAFAADVTWVEFYTTPLGVYLVVAAYVYARLDRDREFPVVFDYFAVAVTLGIPLLVALQAPDASALGHAFWVFGLALLGIAGGVLAKSRAYFFGGVAALVLVALDRSVHLLAEFWWVVLGLLGVVMLVVALTWERQRLLFSDARGALKRSFEDWR